MLERPTTSRMALSATAFTVPSGCWMLNRKSPAPFGLITPEHREIDVDDVLVAGEHQAFFRHVAHGGAAAQVFDHAHADVDAVDARDLRREHGLDRIGQVIVEARAWRRAHMRRSAARRRARRARRGRSRKGPRSATAASTISATPLPPRLPPGSTVRSLSWLRRSRSSRSGGVEPRTVAAPSPRGPCRPPPRPQGPPP